MSEPIGPLGPRMRSQERPELLRRRRRRRIIWIIVGVLLIGGYGYLRMMRGKAAKLQEAQQWEERTVEQADVEVVVSEMGIVEPLTQVIVKSQVAAEVEDILVEEGDTVAQGDVIARLDESRIKQDVDNRAAQVESALAGVRKAEVTLRQTSGTSDAELESAKASIESASAALAMAEEGQRPEDIRQAEERVAQRRADLSAAQAQLMELRAGFRSQEVTEQEEALRGAEAQLAGAEAALGRLNAGTRVEEVQRAREQLSQAEAGAAAATATLAKVRAGSRPQEVRQAEAELDSAQAQLEETEAAFNRQTDLQRAGFTSVKDLQKAQAAYLAAKSTVASRQAALDMVLEGSRVEDIRAAEAEDAQAQASVRAAREQLRLLENGPRSEDIEEQRQAVRAARANRDSQQARLDMMREGSRAEHIQAQEAATTRAEAALREAQAALDLARAGSRNEEIVQAQAALRQADSGLDQAMAQALNTNVRSEDIIDARAQLQSARTQLLRAQEDLGDCTVRSPVTGIVLSRHVEPGELAASGTLGLAQGTPLVTVGDVSELVVRLEVHEVDVVNLRTGLPAEVRLDALQGDVFDGAVLEISPQSSAVSREQAAGQTGQTGAGVVTFEVKVVIDEADERIRPGMSARVKVVCEKVESVPTVTLAALRSKDDRTFVLLPPETPDGDPVERDVTLGMRGASIVEIKEGLVVGDKYLIRKPKTEFELGPDN